MYADDRANRRFAGLACFGLVSEAVANTQRQLQRLRKLLTEAGMSDLPTSALIVFTVEKLS